MRLMVVALGLVCVVCGVVFGYHSIDMRSDSPLAVVGASVAQAKPHVPADVRESLEHAVDEARAWELVWYRRGLLKLRIAAWLFALIGLLLIAASIVARPNQTAAAIG